MTPQHLQSVVKDNNFSSISESSWKLLRDPGAIPANIEALVQIAKFCDFQAEYEGSIPSTCSR
jgi:hypothetical protein